MSARRSRRPGFTLAEMMVVIVILGLLATLVVQNVMRNLSAGQRGKARTDIAQLEMGLEQYAIHNAGRYPDGLGALVAPDPSGHAFLKQTAVPKDPWGREYSYEPPAAGRTLPRVFTLGRDGQPGGEGDDRDLDNEMLRAGEDG